MCCCLVFMWKQLKRIQREKAIANSFFFFQSKQAFHYIVMMHLFPAVGCLVDFAKEYQTDSSVWLQAPSRGDFLQGITWCYVWS